MPELPEVEVVKRSLEKKILNLIIKKVEIIDGKLRYKINKENTSKLIGKKIRKIKRKSKFLIFEIEKNLFMITHLGMTGKFFFIDKMKKKYKTSFYYSLDQEKDQKHNRVIISFKDKQKLIYNDVRKFGFIKFYNSIEFKSSQHFRSLGPEPLGKYWNKEYFKKYISGRDRSIKNILMDQKFVCGLGNIYVNEILFFSCINPLRKVSSLKGTEIENIVQNTKKILRNSIRLGGSSIKNFSTDDGKKGVFQQFFKVYGRKGKNCSNTDCNKQILRTTVANRSTFFCERCQK